MAVELAAEAITANAVAPGPTETELFRTNNPPGREGEARYSSAAFSFAMKFGDEHTIVVSRQPQAAIGK